MYEEKNIVVSGGTAFFAGHPWGWTKDALTIGLEIEKLTIKDVQQKAGKIDVRRTSADPIIKMNLYEFTLENFQKAFGINANVVQGSSIKSLSLDLSGDFPEGEAVIKCKGPDNVARTFTWWKVKVTDPGDISMDAYDPTIMPITMEVLVHPDHSDRGKVEEEYVPSSVVID